MTFFTIFQKCRRKIKTRKLFRKAVKHLAFLISPTVPEFDVSHPVQVDERGRFLSRDLANGNARRKRDLDGTKSKEPVFFKISAFGQDLHLNVTINDELFSPNFEIEIRSNGTSEFHYKIDHCHYTGQVVPIGRTGNKVAISNCEGLVRSAVQTQCLAPEAVAFQ